MRCSPSSTTSSAKSVPVAAAIARTSSCTGLPSVTPQRASGCPMRAASWSVSVVSRPARPGRDELRAAREAREEVRLDEAGRDAHVGRRPTRCSARPARRRRSGPSRSATAASRASWLTTRTAASTSSPSIARSSSSVLPRCVPVATSTTTSSRRTSPSSSSSSAGTTMCARLRARAVADADRDRARAPRTTSRSGGPATGWRSASSTAARPSARRRRMQRLDDGRALVRAGRR